MKRYLMLMLILSGFANELYAQNFTEKSVVKDSTGKLLAYNEWHPKFVSGYYSISSGGYTVDKVTHRITGKKDTSYVLKYITAEDRKLLGIPEPVVAPPQAANAPAIQQQQFVPTRIPQHSNGFTNGEMMEPFTARDIDNKKIDIKKLQGKIIALNFWFINCPACRQEIPELNEVVAQYANDPEVVFIAICLDQRWDIKKFLKQMPYNYQQIADGRSFGDDYKVDLYPTNVVIDKKGVIRFNSVGSANTGYWVKKTIEDIKAEK